MPRFIDHFIRNPIGRLRPRIDALNLSSAQGGGYALVEATVSRQMKSANEGSTGRYRAMLIAEQRRATPGSCKIGWAHFTSPESIRTRIEKRRVESPASGHSKNREALGRKIRRPKLGLLL